MNDNNQHPEPAGHPFWTPEEMHRFAPLQMSDEIDKLLPALVSAQAKVQPAVKDAYNPFYKSHYADLGAAVAASRPQLCSEGIAAVSGIHVAFERVAVPPTADGEPGADRVVAVVTVETRLIHASGQWIGTVISAHARDAGPQSIGLVSTYLRRYGYVSLAFLATEDDDGNAASGIKAPGKLALLPEAVEFGKGLLKLTEGDKEAAADLLRDLTRFGDFAGYRSIAGIRSVTVIEIAKRKLKEHPVFGEAAPAAEPTTEPDPDASYV